jgi:hypothetical protein
MAPTLFSHVHVRTVFIVIIYIPSLAIVAIPNAGESHCLFMSALSRKAVETTKQKGVTRRGKNLTCLIRVLSYLLMEREE